jgi:hypothetical protein
MKPITYFSITVDTEEEWDWRTGWPKNDFSVENVQRLPRFQELCENYGVATTYYTNHAVLDDAEARAVILNLAERPSVEIGMHIHPWNTPPIDPDLWEVTARQSYLHNLSKAQIQTKLTTVFERFVELGLRPTSFRGGRYSSGGPIHDFLRDNRFIADSSVVPYTTFEEDGAPDYRNRGLFPYRLPPRSGGEMPLWEIPLTVAFSRQPFELWHRVREFIIRTWLRKARLVGIMDRLGIVSKIWLNFEVHSADDMLVLLRMLRKMHPPCINFTVHSTSLVAGGNPFTTDTADEDRIFSDIETVFAELAGWDDFQPATVSQIAHHLEKEHHAHPRHQPSR